MMLVPSLEKKRKLTVEWQSLLTVYGDCEGYIMIAQEEEGKVASFPDVVQPLLIEFSNVMPQEIPDGLPLIQDIQYCIDLMLDMS